MTPDANRCPRCGDPNRCGVAQGSDSCWCFEVEVAREALTAIPRHARGAACLCAACAAPDGRVHTRVTQSRRNAAMNTRIMNALFLSTGNAARSLMAQSVLNHLDRNGIRGFSAGSFPRDRADPQAIALLERSGFPTEDLHPKSWDEFAQPGAPEMDFIFTLCDDVAEKVCPVWPGRPVTAHWSVPDPAQVTGDDMHRAEAYRQALHLLERRIELFTMLPLASLDHLSLHHQLRSIGDHT